MSKTMRKIKYFIKDNVLKKNIRVKLICLVISILLFTYVHLDEEEMREYNTNVIIKNIPTNLTLVDSNVNYVNITFIGKRQAFLIMPSRITAYVDLSYSVIGTEEYKILIDNIQSIPKSIKYTISPESIYITLKKKE